MQKPTAGRRKQMEKAFESTVPPTVRKRAAVRIAGLKRKTPVLAENRAPYNFVTGAIHLMALGELPYMDELDFAIELISMAPSGGERRVCQVRVMNARNYLKTKEFGFALYELTQAARMLLRSDDGPSVFVAATPRVPVTPARFDRTLSI